MNIFGNEKNEPYSIGGIEFTDDQAVHALKHFHELADPDRYLEVPYMLGIMGGCFAHACKWTDEFITELEDDMERQDALHYIWVKMISVYFEAKDAGLFDRMNSGLS